MVSENLHIIRDKIEERCRISGRNSADVRLIAVSKNTGLALIKEAVNAGICDLGENKAQELSEKIPLIEDRVKWHFIGHLQTNKVKFVAGNVEFIHSVDSMRLASEISRMAAQKGIVQKILLEIKTSDEATKYGLSGLKEITEIAAFCSSSASLKLEGLMTMAPYSDDEKIIRKSFSDLRKLRDILRNEGFPLTELSMGMTSDFDLAIEEGSTMVRIGTALFGKRDYSKSWKEQ